MPHEEMPFEGRERELDSLMERWRLASEGAGQVAMVSAAAGVGKSRLVEAFAHRTAGEPRALLICRCSRSRRFTAFSPLVDLLRRLEGRRVTDSPGAAEPEERLRATLVARLRALVVPSPRPRTTALNLHPEGRARKTLEELLRLFLESAKRLPVLWVVEDLDWADPSTLALLELLANRRLHVPWMTVLTFSSGFEPPWGQRAGVTHLELSRLARRQEEALLDRLMPTLDPELRREVIARADGVPLYLVEQTRLIRETGLAGDDRRSAVLPTILKHWLSARLERLGAAGDVARWAAVVGDELSAKRLAALAPFDAAALEQELDRLVAAGILARPGAVGELAFSHPLIHETIHGLMPVKARRDAHRRMAEILRDSAAGDDGRAGSDSPERDPELIADHYGEAGLPIEAASWWCRAAEQAVLASANLEAAERARQGLRHLDAVAESAQRQSLEVDLEIVLGASLGIARGFAAAGAVAAYDRALELVWQAPQAAADHFSALQELTSYYLSRGHVSTALEVAARAARELDVDDLERRSNAQRALGFARLLEGDFTGAESALEKSLAAFSAHRSPPQATPPALAAAIAEARSHLSLTEWFLGRPGRALKQSADSLTLARRSNDPYSRVFTVFRASYLHVFRREPIATRELAHELVELANRHGFLFFIAAGMFLEGQALAAQGRAAEGLHMMSGGLDGVWASGMEASRPRNLALLAEACARSELFEQGLSLVREGIAAVEITGEGHYAAELFRIQGELLRHAGGPDEELEENFLQALGLARRQGSVSLELRAAVSLGRLRQAQGEPRLARELLAEVYGKFDDGFDTADLKQARELLDELS